MPPLRLYLIFLLFLVLIVGDATQAQEEDVQQRPIVGFVIDQTLNAASVADTGPTGISRLAQIFRSLGAEIQIISLQEPIPLDVNVVVLVGPRSAPNAQTAARLWAHLERGNHLFLAVNPSRHVVTGSSIADTPLTNMLYRDYGIQIQDTFLVQPWFNHQAISTIASSYHRVYPETLAHDIIEPLMTYELPIQVWGATSMTVEPLGVNSTASPLLATSSAYGTLNRAIFNQQSPAPLEPTQEDFTGQLVVSALAQNTATQSRVVVLGDAEAVMNGFGLDQIRNTTSFIHVSNQIFMERVGAWLLGLPAESWPELPGGFTWVSIDGRNDDWSSRIPVVTDSIGDVTVPEFDIQQVRAFRNEDNLYLLIETVANPNSQVRVYLELDSNRDGSVDVTVGATIDEVAVLGEQGIRTVVPDAAIAINDGIEMRLPLRITGRQVRIRQVCLLDNQNGDESQAITDCLDQVVDLPAMQVRDPLNMRFPEALSVAVIPTSAINLMAAPRTDSTGLAALQPQTILAAVARTSDARWIKVETARLSGWVATSLVIANGDLSVLPVEFAP